MSTNLGRWKMMYLWGVIKEEIVSLVIRGPVEELAIWEDNML